MIRVFGHPGKVDILAVGVHPDDIELSCAGTLLKHMSLGYTVGIADLTKGELGSRGNADLRLKESADAAKYLGIDFRVNLEMQDGFFRNDRANLIRLIKVIRLSRPGLILGNALDDRHPDHGRAAKLIADAFFYSGLAKIEIEDLPPYRAGALYHYIQDKNLSPDLCIDVSGFEKQKMASIRCFSSQFHDPASTEPETPISSKQFLDFILAKMATFGRSIGVDYAEGFNVNRTPGVKDLHDLI